MCHLPPSAHPPPPPPLVSVHPIEFATGEYNHLLTLWLVAAHLLPWAGRAAAQAGLIASPEAWRMHVAVPVVFVVLGGVLATLNHTRFDVRFPVPGLEWFFEVSLQRGTGRGGHVVGRRISLPAALSARQTRLHDVHHWYLNANYYQYCVLWDWVFGTYKPYPAGTGAGGAGGGESKAADEQAEAAQREQEGKAEPDGVRSSKGKRAKVA
jgi:hypothetical protein